MVTVKKDGFIFPEESAKEKAIDLFPISYQAQLVAAINRAYSLADTTAHDPSSSANWLSFGRGDSAIFSRIKQIAVEMEICRLIEAGVLPYDYHYKYNINHNHKYLVISKKDKFHMTVNQCRSGVHPAKKSEYRLMENTNYQTRFILDAEDLLYDNKPSEEYFELNHGYKTKTPSFVCLGIPELGANHWAFNLNLPTNIQLLKSKEYKSVVEGPDTITPDEFAAYFKRESND